jgi:hypothetical protein
MILGARLEGEGMCISSVSLALRPTRSGDSTRRCSCLPSAVWVVSRGARPMDEPSDSDVSAMRAVGREVGTCYEEKCFGLV